MIIVGLTGGIGSGKTTIAELFSKQFGIPVYIADSAAKRIIQTDDELREQISDFFGEEAFIDGKYNSSYIAKIVFSDAEKLKRLNAIIHPAVEKDFQKWVKMQVTPYVIKESAILFESGSYKDCDLIISVVAPIHLRIQRVMLRDGVDKKSVENRIKNQWTDQKRIKYSNFVIKNQDKCKILDKIKIIHSEILKII